jgi:hypothetical protein
MKKAMFFGVILSAMLMNSSCSKENQQQNTAIPYVEINEKISINDPKYSALANVGGWVYYTAGSRGLILYRESTQLVRAIERHCTYDPTEVCSTVDMDLGLLQANDNDCCGSIFSIQTASILKGPASKPLLEYQTDFDGTYVIVTN